METRRIRRLERRRVHRTAVLSTALAALGVALGLALPRSTLGAIVIFAAAGCGALMVMLRDESVASLHGLRRVVRLPLRRSVSATFESFSSRVAGSLRVVLARRPTPTPQVLDEPEDEAEAWWGPASASVDPLSPAPAESPLRAPELPAPVVSAPVGSARVPADGGPTGPSRVEQLLVGTRRHVDALTKRFRRHDEEAAPTVTS
jgi:hypothetical protein